MKCIEMIQLRAAGEGDRIQALKVCEQIIQSNSDEQPLYTTLLRNTMLDTDLCVFICWNRPHDSHRESVLGQQIEKGLSGFGLLNHSLWLGDETFFLAKTGDNYRREVQFNKKWLKETRSPEKNMKGKIYHDL